MTPDTDELVRPTGKGEQHCRWCGRMSYIGSTDPQHHDDCPSFVVASLTARLHQVEQELEQERQTSLNDPAEARAERYAAEARDLTARLMQVEQERDEARSQLQFWKDASDETHEHWAADRLRAETAERERDEAIKRLRIVELSTPLEEDLTAKIDAMCRYLAMEDGFTLNGIARLLNECQRRMAADYDIIGRERRERKSAERERDEARRERDRLDGILSRVWGVVDGGAGHPGEELDVVVESLKLRAETAEHERDEARRALDAEYEIVRTDPAEQRAERYALEAMGLTDRLMAAEASLTTLRGDRDAQIRAAFEAGFDVGFNTGGVTTSDAVGAAFTAYQETLRKTKTHDDQGVGPITASRPDSL